MEPREWLANSSAAPPTRPAAPSTGYPQGGVTPTKPGAYWYYQITEELRAVVAAGGLAPDATKLTQLLTAIQAFIQGQAMTSAADTGAANVCAVTYAPAITALTDGMALWFKAKATNTGATTLNVNGLGAAPVVGAAHSALQGGEIVANGRCLVVWNAALASWVLIDCTGGARQVAAGTRSNQALNLGQIIGTSVSLAGSFSIPVMTAGGSPVNLIIKWGSSPASAGGSNVTFPIAFPNAVFIVVGGNNISAGATSAILSGTTTGFVSYISTGSGNNFWIAFGY